FCLFMVVRLPLTTTTPMTLQGKSTRTKFRIFGEIIIKNTILKTIQRISHTQFIVLPPLNLSKNQQPYA
ncbi:hypothetical protein AB4491_30250, partial [Vibrio sp. 10N.261.45.A7]